MSRLRKISFKTKLILTVEFFVVVITVAVGIVAYKNLSLLVREVSREKLISIASSTAAVIDEEKHSSILNEADVDSENYLEIKETFRKIIQANENIEDIYTFRKSDTENIWNFVVDADEESDVDGNGIIDDDEMPAKVGEEYDVTYFPEMKKSFEGATADHEISCDRWGCWLSGYAPIINSKGEAVAIVGVDIPAEDILVYERRIKTVITYTLGAVIVAFPILLLFLLRFLLNPVSKIAKSISKLSDDLSTRIEINSEDEFGVIARSFNKMALELEVLYKKMKNKVEKKSKDLAVQVEDSGQKQAKIETILGSIGEGIIATDKKGVVIMANHQTEIILSKNSKNILGLNVEKIFELKDEYGKEVAGKFGPIQKALEEGSRVSGKYYYIKSENREVPIHITASPVSQSGKITGVVAVFRDITKEDEVDKAKTEFVSLASHQLRTPLAMISWYSEALLDDDKNFSSKQKENLLKIKKSNERMLSLVRSLLNVSRLEVGTFVIEAKNIDLIEIAREVIEEVGALAVIQNITIERRFSDDKIIFKGDSQLVRMIIQNLLTNAVKYSKENGKVLIEIFKKSGRIVIRVKDGGIGIPESEKEKIFTKMFRAKNIKEKDADGTGLGLYIVKSIVDHSGGNVYFESKESKGSVFTVDFPETGMRERKGTKNLI